MAGGVSRLPGVDEAALGLSDRAPSAPRTSGRDSRRVSAGSITSSSSKRVAALSALRVLVGARRPSASRRCVALGRRRRSRRARALKPSLTAPSRPIAPSSAVGQPTVEQRLVQAAAGHRLGAEPVGLAQDHRDERHPQVGADDEQPRAVADERRSPRRPARPSSPACRSARGSGSRRRRRAA